MVVKYRKNSKWKFFNFKLTINNLSELDNMIKIKLDDEIKYHNKMSSFKIKEVDIVETTINLINSNQNMYEYIITLGCSIQLDQI